MESTHLPEDILKTRQKAKNSWNESDTARAPINRSPEQYKIKFEMGVMLFCAVSSKDIEETLRLLDKGADPNYANALGLTALQNACIDENFPMVKLLIDRGADVNATDNEGWSPLHAAACGNELEIVKFLVKKGADVALVNADHYLPVDLAENDLIKEYLDDMLNDSGSSCSLSA
ncbi:hypothetical protein MXB_1687 [Myxobolus squamalis]|nr:hypothetical protein MXB_1687 [Myxobolus squamalis]